MNYNYGDLVSYNNREWFYIGNNSLLLMDQLSIKDLKKVFHKSKIYNDGVIYNDDVSNPFWRDSYVRMSLNANFLCEFNEQELEPKHNTTSFNNQMIETYDFISLLSLDEVNRIRTLDSRILETSFIDAKTRYFKGYWISTPSLQSFSIVEYGVPFKDAAYNRRVNEYAGVRPLIILNNTTFENGLVKCLKK